jgi:hypothetical protein
MLRLCLLVALAGGLADARAQAPGDDALAAGFARPPPQARPLVWWHWMDGNITGAGIDKDLAWFARIGLGGVQNFDAGLRTPTIVAARVAYQSPQWKTLFRHAVEQADAKGLSYGTAASPGWSETGGPWVPPQDGMKKLVWSSAIVAGGASELRLPAPPDAVGPYQDLRRGQGHPPDGGRRFVRDVMVLAWPLREAAALPVPQAFVSSYPIDADSLHDPRAGASISVPAGTPEQPTDITLRYDTPQTVRSATMFMEGAAVPFQAPRYVPQLQARIDGRWQAVARMPIEAVPTTVSFAPVSADGFRLVLTSNPHHVRPVIDNPSPGVDVGPDPKAAERNVLLTTFTVSAQPQVHRFEAKAGYATAPDYFGLDDPADESGAIDPDQVIRLTGKLQPDGTLKWKAPPGRWRVLRLAYSLLGTTNHPAPAEATGLEVDKYDPAAVTRYFDTYLAQYRQTVGDALFGRRGLQTIVTDSIESGNANWTPRLLAEFKRLRGYDPTPYLPALTGVVVKSRTASDGFLYDYRRTLAELLASAHYGILADISRRNGLTLFGEALETNRPQLGDDLAMRRHADIPMAALWTFNPAVGPNPTYVGDMKGAASVAHVYGRPLAAAETLTAGLASYAFAPSDLKRVIDLAFASGINRPVLHSSVHQPVDDKRPGLTLSGFGQYFNRHDTWAEHAKPWVDYIARSSHLLQQGSDVADVAWFIGEEAPVTAQWANGVLGQGITTHAYDYVNADMLMHALSVQDGQLTSQGGARYRVLYLGEQRRQMTVSTLRAITRLVQAGATVVGVAPVYSPSLADRRQDFDALVDGLWHAGRTGKGRVLPTTGLAQALRGLDVAADVSVDQAQDALRFVHRQLPRGHLYFLHTTASVARRVQASFRVTGLAPERWHADTGRREPLPYTVRDGHTVVPLDLEAEDAAFIVFRQPTDASSRVAGERSITPLLSLDDGWQLQLGRDAGAIPPRALAGLPAWNRSEDPGVRYFSGSGIYTRTFTLAQLPRAGARMLLDLGQVGDLARVRLNGQEVGTAWHAPYRLDITDAVRAGRNALEIEVTNLWVNRLIGDAQPGASAMGFTTAIAYRADAPLRPSGLLGPVRVLESARAPETQTAQQAR